MAETVSARLDLPGEMRLNEVEKELARLWEEAVDGEGVPTGEAKQRVCTLTLIVAGFRGLPDQAMELLAPTIALYPARTIYLGSPQKNNGSDIVTLTASISARCQRVGAGNQVCSEEIFLHDRGATRAEIESGISLLLVPGLPALLWWLRPPDEDPEQLFWLAEMADRVIVDSALSASSVDAVRIMASLTSHPSTSPEDLSWDRSIVWRSALAQQFDPPDLRPLLAQVCSVEIEYPEAAETQALLLSGWLASRLGWAVKRPFGGPTGGVREAQMTAQSGHGVRVLLRRAEGLVTDAEHLVSVRLGCEDRRNEEARQWDFRIARSSLGDCAVANVEVAGRPAEHHIIPLDLEDLPLLLSRALGHLAPDPVFEDALSLSLQMLGESSST